MKIFKSYALVFFIHKINIIVLTIVYEIQYNNGEVIQMSDNSLLTNLVVELRRGTQIIAVLSQLKENQYGYSLLQKLEEKQINIEAGTLYPLMRRLESQGILHSEWDTTESRPRKYYRLSDFGDEILIELKNEWKKLTIEMDELFKEIK